MEDSVSSVEQRKRHIHYIFVDHENVQPTDIKALDRADVRLWLFVGNRQTKLSAELAMQVQEMGARAKYVRISAVGANALDFHIAYHIGRLAAQDAEGHFHVISKDKGYDPLLAHLKAEGIVGLRSETIAALPMLGRTKKPLAMLPAADQEMPSGKVAGGGLSKSAHPKRAFFIVEPAAAPANGNKPVPAPPPKPKPVVALSESGTTAQRWTKLRSGLKKMDANRPASMSALRKHVNAQFNGDQLGQDVVEALIAGLVKFGLLTVAGSGKLTWHGDRF